MASHANSQRAAYAVAVFLPALVTWIDRYIVELIGPPAPTTVYAIPVLVAGVIGGFRPAVTAIVCSIILGAMFLLEPHGTLIAHPRDATRLGLTGIVCLLIATLAGWLHRERDRVLEALTNAEEANRAKEQFFAMLSHEVRTPLNPALLEVSALLQRTGLPQDVRAALETVQRCLQTEARFFDDLLDLNRAAHGKLSLELERISIRKILDESIQAAQDDTYSEKHLTLEIHDRATEKHVKGDAVRLGQIFTNLLRNAVKFTPVNGRIDVTISNPQAHFVEIAIKDTGIGIERDALERIFSPFEQGRAGFQRGGGLGLGLAIAHALAELHDASLGVSSEGPGKGTTFTVTLPTVPAPAEVPVAAPIPEPAPTTIAPGPRLDILLVEDHAQTAATLSRLLSRYDDVRVANTLAEAREKVAERMPELLLADLNLPDGSGYDLMRMVRSQPEGQAVTAIALSGFGADTDVAATKAAGFSRHMVKPLDWPKLRDAVDSVRRSLMAHS